MRASASQLSLPLVGLPQTPVPRSVEQPTLFGPPVPVRIPAELWEQWLTDPGVRARFQAKVHRRGEKDCHFWTHAISSTGHGSFRAASLPGKSRRGTVPAHLYAFQLMHGVIPRLGWTSPVAPAVCHRCDEASCCNVAHLRLATGAINTAEWAARRHDPRGPLADLRGPAGRARDIATAIRTGLAAGESAERITARIIEARTAGLPLTLF